MKVCNEKNRSSWRYVDRYEKFASYREEEMKKGR